MIFRETKVIKIGMMFSAPSVPWTLLFDGSASSPQAGSGSEGVSWMLPFDRFRERECSLDVSLRQAQGASSWK
jgi:hypothetical protein